MAFDGITVAVLLIILAVVIIGFSLYCLLMPRLFALRSEWAAGIGGIGITGSFEPSFGGVLRDEIAADRGL